MINNSAPINRNVTQEGVNLLCQVVWLTNICHHKYSCFSLLVDIMVSVSMNLNGEDLCME